MKYEPRRNEKGIFIKTDKRVPNCISCGISDQLSDMQLTGKYAGMCRACRRRAYYRDNKERENAKCRAYYHSQDGLLRMKERWFGGNYTKTLDLDGHKCVLCGSTENLQIHHIDHSGIKSKGSYKKSNNSIENLITLCDSCHTTYHSCLTRKRKELAISMREKMIEHNHKKCSLNT